MARCKWTYLTLNRCFVGVVEYNSRQGRVACGIGERDSKKVVLWSVGVVEAGPQVRDDFAVGLEVRGGCRWHSMATCMFARTTVVPTNNTASHTTCGVKVVCVLDAPY